MKAKVNKLTIRLLQADLLDMALDALVYPTEPMLTLSTRLRQMGGDVLIQSALDLGWCDVGQAMVGDGGQLKTPKIIYTVPPKWGEDSARGKLANTVWAVLEKAEASHYRRIVMPPIGTGVMGYPIENCAMVMIEQIIDYSYEMLKHLREVHICVDTPESLQVFSKELASQMSHLDDEDTAQTI
jgi:O-acetyl-ADP-ribose deacetylase (regulator of RNase III)